MWSNLLRFVGDGTAVGELVEVTGLQKPRVLSALGGVERWRYVTIEEGRVGYGSARGLKDDFVVQLTPAGRRAAAIWPDLGAVIETRWRERFGTARIAELEGALREVVDPIASELPAYVPILVGSSGMALDLPRRERAERTADEPLVVLLARAVMRYGIDFESESPLSLALSANLLRVLDETGVGVPALPQRAGISKEAVAMALTALRKTTYVEVAGPTATKAVVRLSRAGRDLRARHADLHESIEKRWVAELGGDLMTTLRGALECVLDDSALSEGLRPLPGGWRAGKRYRAQTEALNADPREALPHAPMVLPRGGWPDGS
jgi:hypothetical protein